MSAVSIVADTILGVILATYRDQAHPELDAQLVAIVLPEPVDRNRSTQREDSQVNRTQPIY